MAIIKQYHKDTDTTYVYESVSYWDEEKKQSRSRRRVIGKLDPVTGEVIPTGKRGRKSKEEGIIPDSEASADAAIRDQEKIRELTLALSSKNTRIAELEKENRELRDILSRLGKLTSQCAGLCAPFTGEGR